MNKTDFVGNDRAINQLGVLVNSGRFPHALIIEGDVGLGKRTLARQLAAALVCREDDAACMNCSQCRKAMTGVHPDVFEYSAPGGANSFHIDIIRSVINSAYVLPNEADYKVFILGNAECMSMPAQNALLKVLEEPPSYVVFILTAKSKSMLLETVLSRSVVVTLEGVNADDGAKYICSKNPDIDYGKAVAALETFNGNIGKAIESFGGTKTNELTEVCCDICKALAQGNEYLLLCSCSAFQKDRQSVVFACDFLKNIFRDALLYNKCSDNLISGQDEAAKQLKARFTEKKLIDLIEVCDTLKSTALLNTNNALLITKLCYSLMRAAGR